MQSYSDQGSLPYKPGEDYYSFDPLSSICKLIQFVCVSLHQNHIIFRKIGFNKDTF